MANFVRVSKSKPCPICGRCRWCLVARDGGAVICPRVSDGAVKRLGDAGWLHRLHSTVSMAPPQRRLRRVAIDGQRSDLDFVALAARFTEFVDSAAMATLADGLGISESCLLRVGVGWAPSGELRRIGTKCRSTGAWTFPMCDSNGAVVGIRLRTTSGFKFAVAGSRQGLFMPVDLPDDELLLLPEGATDTAALLDLGFAAAGRPSCFAGTDLVVQLIKRRCPSEVVVVADRDEVGQSGARVLAAAVRAHCPVVRVLLPPEGIKDARAWKSAGATHADVVAAIREAPVLDLGLRVRTRRAR